MGILYFLLHVSVNINCSKVLTCVAQCVECYSTKQKFGGSIPGQGTRLGCRAKLRRGACERQSIDVSLTHRYFSPSLSPSLPSH